MTDHISPEADAHTGGRRHGRFVLAALLAALLLLAVALLMHAILVASASSFEPLMLSIRVALTLVLFYAVWIGQPWARWLFVVVCGIAVLRLIAFLISNPNLLLCGFIALYFVSGLILAFSKSVNAFLKYQQTQRAALYKQDRRRILRMVAAIVVVGAGMATVLYTQARNRWPESFTRRLAELKAGGVPITLADCDRQYRALGSDPAAVKHFQNAFATMSKEKPPLTASQSIAHVIPHPALPKLSEMAASSQRLLVASCLKSNAEALRLLHEGMSYDRCLFPMNLADGFQDLLPHLEPCMRGAHLLALESIQNIYDGDTEKSAASILAELHMAEILRDEPNLVGVPVRDRIIATGCVSLQTCLNVAPFSTRDLVSISARLQESMEESQKCLRTVLVNERSQGISIFKGSDQQIADFLADGHARLGLRLSVEAMRAPGILQQDAAYFVDFIGRIEMASTNGSDQQMATRLAILSSEIERNRHLDPDEKKHWKIISCMLLPGVIRAVQADLWTQTFGKVAMAAIAVERHRRDFGDMPTDLDALVPRFLPRVADDPYTGQPISFQQLPKGYTVYTGGTVDRDSGHRPQAGEAKFDSGEIVFRVER